MDIIKDGLVADPALQTEIIGRAVQANLGDHLTCAVDELGRLRLPDGRIVRVALRHAADAILIDDHGQTILITRMHSPGIGLLAIPGGFIEWENGHAEDTADGARREAVEETGIAENLIRDLAAIPVGSRRYQRPFDIRAAWSDLAGTDLKKGDVFAVSTQGFLFRFPGDLRDLPLQAGDDAKAVGVFKIAELTPAQFAVPDHLVMIEAAKILAGV